MCPTRFLTSHSQGKYCSPGCARKGARKSWRDYGGRNREQRRQYSRDLYDRTRDAVLERTKAYHKTPAGRAMQQTNGKRMRAKYQFKVLARQMVAIAIRMGILKKQPCRDCGASDVHAHHPDYSKPLEVIWLCPPCHRAEHRAAKAVEISTGAQA